MTQTVTPELRQWIVQQAQAGFTPASVLQAMRDSGWQEDVALTALEETLQQHLQAQGLSLPVQESPALPEPDLTGSPLYLDLPDRRVHVLQTLQNPRVVVFGNLFSDQECEQLIALAKPRLARSLTVETKTGGEELNAARSSDGMFFQRGQTPLIEQLEARIAHLLNWPLENGEGLQVLRYRPGAEYKPHYDYFDPDAPGTPTILRRGGQRVGTLIIYLSEPERGGGTVFPDVALEVAPKRGNGVFFSYARAHPDTRSLHGGAPVLAGEKWVATKWLREREFK